MSRKTIILKVCNQWIGFNPHLRIPIGQSNLPIEYFTFRTYRDIYWKVEMVSFSGEDFKLYAKVLNYNSDDISPYEKQTPKKNIAGIFFEFLDWSKLEPLLATYQKAKLNYLIDAKGDGGALKNATPNKNTESRKKEIDIDLPSKQLGIPDFAGVDVDELHQNLKVYNLRVAIPVEQVKFRLGCVKVEFDFAETDECVEFKVENEHIIPEFDHIKHWFAKKLGIKKFKFDVQLKASAMEVKKCEASSEHILAINPQLIDSVKMERSLNLLKKPSFKKPDQELFTADEMFDQFGEEPLEGNVFKQTDNDLLKFLMETGQVRNKKHLAYLASKKQSPQQKLRYTLQPNFGFLFVTEGETGRHFIWELLNSHATYVWSFPKNEADVQEQFKRIEAVVNMIRTHGRQEYRANYQRNPLDADVNFCVIEHENVSSLIQDGFVKWRQRLNEQIT